MTKTTKSGFFNSRVWKIVRWPLGLLLIAYIALVIYRVPKVHEERETAATVAAIHNEKLTLDDMMGKNLPPEPSPQWRDATIAGMDVNHNGIRDDVELAIFQKYPNDPKIRAAELQYALALQKELTMVTNSDTLVAAMQEEARAIGCLESNTKTNEIKDLVLNTQDRKNKRETVFKDYMVSFSLINGVDCDIDSISS